MGTWRYVASVGRHDEDDDLDWEIRKLYPTDNGKFSYTVDSVKPFGNSYDELVRDIENMRQNRSREILDLRGDEPKLTPVEDVLANLPPTDAEAPSAATWKLPAALCAPTEPGPRFVCICGSTRFRDEITDANRRLTLAGVIVVAPAIFQHRGDQITDEQKLVLDELHLRKIDLADVVLVVDPGGYVGDSTRREIDYADRVGTPVFRLSSWVAG